MYDFDKLNATWKISGATQETIEALFLDKLHRTHAEYMETPKEIIDLLLIKRSSDAKAEQKRLKDLKTKRK